MTERATPKDRNMEDFASLYQEIASAILGVPRASLIVTASSMAGGLVDVHVTWLDRPMTPEEKANLKLKMDDCLVRLRMNREHFSS